MHEVGHTLGLTHNFRASTVYTRAQLQDKDFTEKNGISGSVMDYNGYNVAAAGEPEGSGQRTSPFGEGQTVQGGVQVGTSPRETAVGVEPGQENPQTGELRETHRRENEPPL